MLPVPPRQEDRAVEAAAPIGWWWWWWGRTAWWCLCWGVCVVNVRVGSNACDDRSDGLVRQAVNGSNDHISRPRL